MSILNKAIKWTNTNRILAAGVLMFIMGVFLLERETGLNLNLVYVVITSMTTLGPSLGESAPPPAIIAAIALLAMSGAILIFGIMTSHIGFKMKEVEDNILEKIGAKQHKLKGHIIVCGYGGVGAAVVKYLSSRKQDVLIIEKDPNRETELQHLAEIRGYIIGDAKNKGVLQQACIEDASGLVVALSNSSENIFVALVAKQLNDKIKISTHIEDVELKESFFTRYNIKDITPVSLGEIGGELLGMSIIKPDAASFIHELLTSEGEHSIRGVEVKARSVLVGKTIGTIRACAQRGIDNKKLDAGSLEKCMEKPPAEDPDKDYNIGIVAMKRGDKVIMPQSGTKINEGDVLLVIARDEVIEPIKVLGQGKALPPRKY